MTFEEIQERIVSMVNERGWGNTPDMVSFVPLMLRELAIHMFLYGGNPDDEFFVKTQLTSLNKRGYVGEEE